MSLRNSTIYWLTRHGNVSEPPTSGMVARRVGHVRSRTDHIFPRAVFATAALKTPSLCPYNRRSSIIVVNDGSR